MNDSDIKEIKEKLDLIINFFGIGKNIVRLSEIREKARKDVERAKKNERKNPA